jgi:hypothetical protein
MPAVIDRTYIGANKGKSVTIALPQVPAGDVLFMIAQMPVSTATVSTVLTTGAGNGTGFMGRHVGASSVVEFWGLGIHTGAENGSVTVNFSAGSNASASIFTFGGLF